ncbi:hypothetical protein L2E82_06143 [Cichorium intybus]|uniref:Uncharacterized protein n=1 Tax=Cichorium intybus TaxID=13427 RepID=A0ACB9H9Z1_CICIN|nr:hypothetical protein L2E82_06143 [Cichorium intybus]
MITLPSQSSSDSFLSLSLSLVGVLPSPAAEDPPAHPLYHDSSLVSTEESRTIQASNPDDSQIRSPDNYSLLQYGDSNPKLVVSLSKQASDGKSDVKCFDRVSSCRLLVIKPNIAMHTRSEIDILDEGFN